MYQEAYKYRSDYYDNFMMIFLTIQTIIDLIVELPEYIIRRQNFAKGGGYGTPSKLIEGFSTLEETFNKFDDKLRKRGYLK